MADVTELTLGVIDQETGNNNNGWGDIADQNFLRIVAAITGVSDLSGLTGGTLVITAEENRNGLLECSGTLTDDQVIEVQAAKKWWFVQNATTEDFTLTIKTNAGTGVTVPQGGYSIVRGDGINVQKILDSEGLKPLGTVDDNRLVKTDGTDGLSIQQTGISVDDNNNVTGIVALAITGAFSGATTGTFSGVVGKAATSGIVIPSGVTGEREGTEPQLRINTTLNVLEARYGGIWQPVGYSPGDIKAWPTSIVPAGWLECNGAEVDRTTFAALFAILGETYGNGDGSTTFSLPDLRGEFIRGWDHGEGNDPDAPGRTDRGDGTTGDNVGTKQADELRSHNHTYTRYTSKYPRTKSSAGGAITWENDGNQNTSDIGGSETRGRNVAMMFCIKY